MRIGQMLLTVSGRGRDEQGRKMNVRGLKFAKKKSNERRGGRKMHYRGKVFIR